MTWWVPVLAFAGGLLGAAIPAWVNLRGQRQAGRGEWRERLDQAIELVSSHDDNERQIGDELLADLIGSDLGSSTDRELARRVAQIRVRQQLAEAAAGLDPAAGESDTESSKPKEAP